MLKQLFAGACGITLLGQTEFGWDVGTPLDVLDGWRADTRAGRKQLDHDLQVEDPYVTVVTHPCGPWGEWSRFNMNKGGAARDTVLGAREAAEPSQRLVSKTIDRRVRAGRHVLCEHPARSEAWAQPEMKEAHALFNEGLLFFVRCDGCALGYTDSVTGAPLMKPMGFVTDMEAAVIILARYRCDRSCEHQYIEGSNELGKRSAQAAVWPDKLDRIVADIIEYQMVIDAARGISYDAFPAEGRAQDPQRRTARLRRRVGLLPPKQPPDAEPNVDQEAPSPVPGEGHAPSVPGPEAGRREEWKRVPDDLKKEPVRLHTNLGHPSQAGLLRLLRRAGARPDVLKAASLVRCDVCGSVARAKHPRPARIHDVYDFNGRVLLDTLCIKDANGLTHSMLNIVCDGTTYQVVWPLLQSTGVPPAELVRKTFCTVWSSWAGFPQQVFVDRGKEFLEYVCEWLRGHGVEVSTSST